MLPDFRPSEIVRVLVEHEVTCVLIGGYAAYAQGSPFPTTDVDITPEQSPANLGRLSTALRALDAKIRVLGEEPLVFAHNADSLAAARVWNLSTKFGDLDLSFVPSGTQGFDDLIRDSSFHEVDGVAIRMASLADIIRSKQAANRPKDQRVLPVLREILATRHEREPG